MCSGMLSVVVILFKVGLVICANYVSSYAGELEENIHCSSFSTV